MVLGKDILRNKGQNLITAFFISKNILLNQGIFFKVFIYYVNRFSVGITITKSQYYCLLYTSDAADETSTV